MLSLLATLLLAGQADVRTPAIYRCPAAEAETHFFNRIVEESGYDSVCIEPKPGPKALALAKGRLKFVDAKTIDTPANLNWRNATIAFAGGKISPKEWLKRTSNLRETVHFLSSPKTPDLRTAMSSVPIDPGQTFSGPSVFAEFLLLCWPGKPCLTASDTWQTRYLPPPGRHESWVLAMRDFLGPLLYFRAENPFLVTNKPKIIRADAKPGLLVFQQSNGKTTFTFYFNNSYVPVDIPKVDPDKVSGISRGFNLDEDKPRLMPRGVVIEESSASGPTSSLP